jgi:hypothetical protein
MIESERRIPENVIERCRHGMEAELAMRFFRLPVGTRLVLHHPAVMVTTDAPAYPIQCLEDDGNMEVSSGGQSEALQEDLVLHLAKMNSIGRTTGDAMNPRFLHLHHSDTQTTEDDGMKAEIGDGILRMRRRKLKSWNGVYWH